MNESAWDVIDERSAASDNEDSHGISRVQTPMSEAPEPIYPEAESLAGNDTSSEGQEHPGRVARFSYSRKDSSSDPPDTARPFGAVPKRHSVMLENQNSYIKFQEDDGEGEQEVSFVLTEFDEAERKKLKKEFNLGGDDGVAGTVRQRMKSIGLSTSGPFKVVYAGPVEMKESVVNKIASALAASPGFSPRNSLISSRVTVVPISSFADDSSPDVVLIDSMGIDMNIEECKSAKEDNQDITLMMTNHSRTRSIWNETVREFELPGDYDIPDLAVIYVPQRENSAAKMTRNLARKFFNRHHIPTQLISYDTKWKKTSHIADVDIRLPHLSIEAFKLENHEVSIRKLRRQAVDISTFISIDSAQLSRSLATIISQRATLSTDTSSKLIADTSFVPTLGDRSRPTFKRYGPLSYLKIGLTIFGICIMLLLRRDQIFPSMRQYRIMVEVPKSVSSISSTPTTTPITVSSLITSTVTRILLPSPSTDTEHIAKLPVVADLLKDNLYQNKSDKFQVQVVGDSHVILRSPAWFAKSKSQPNLIIKVFRSKKPVPHELSTLFSGVHALKFAPEHAHGSLEITLSTLARPKVHEIFHVDLGNPWLKISGWQRAALLMKEHLTEDFFTARVGLLNAYSHTNTRVQYFFKDAVIKADSLMKEAEKISLDSFSCTLQNTDQLLSQTKSFTLSLTERLRLAALSHTPALFSIQHESLSRDLSEYSKKISTLFITQAKSLSNAASSLVSIGQDIQAYRSTHFVHEQKRLLRTWWSVFGIPSHLKTKMQDRSRQDLLDEEIWTGRSNKRREARKAHRAETKKSGKQGNHNEDHDEYDSHPVRERYRRAVASMMAMRRRTAEARFEDSDTDNED